MTVKLSLSGSPGSSSSSLSSFRNNSSFQTLRRVVSEHFPCTTASTFSNTTTTTTATTTTTTIITPSSTIASCGESRTSPHVSPQFDAATLLPSAPAPTILSCSSPRPTATAATISISAGPPPPPPPPEDVIKLLLSTTTYIYDSLTKLIDANNTLRRSNSRISRDQPICRANTLRGALNPSRAAIITEASSSNSCPSGMAHDALHIVNSHRAFARAIKGEIAKLSAALAYFSPLSQSLRLCSFLSSLTTSTPGSGLGAKMGKRHKHTGGEKLTVWSDIKKIIFMYDWLWTYSYSENVENWQDVTWACAVVTGVYGAGGLEAVNARMRDYGIAHVGVVDRFCVADWGAEWEVGERQGQGQARGSGDQKGGIVRHGARGEVIVRRKMARIDGKWVQVDPGAIVAGRKDEVVNESREGVGCMEGRWKVKLQVPGGVVAVRLKVKLLGESVKGKEREKCGEGKGKAKETIEDVRDEEYEKAMWG